LAMFLSPVLFLLKKFLHSEGGRLDN